MDTTPIHRGQGPLTAFFSRHRIGLFCLLLAIITLSVYWQVSHNGFVSFDDNVYISGNLHVREGLSIENIKWAFGFPDIAYWHPLTWISHMVDSQLFGLKAGGHHLTNLVLHILNALLLFLFFQRVTGDFWRSGFVAALFAFHPINVESVAWVAERKNVLCTFFGMLTLLAYAWYARRPCRTRYLLTLTLFVLGLMSKPVLITLPVVLLLLDFWPLQRLHLTPPVAAAGIKAVTSAFKGSGVSRLVFEKIPFLMFSIASVVLSILSAQSHEMMLSTYQVPLPLRIQNAVVSYLGYIGKTIWPYKLAVFYPFPGTVPIWLTIGVGFWLMVMTFLILYKWQRFPYLVVGWLWYIITLSPSIGIVQAGLWPAMADRWAYIPLIGIFIITAWGLPQFLAGWRHKKAGLATMATAAIAVLLMVTWLQVRYWANSLTLFQHALDVTEKNDVAHNNLGARLYYDGKIDEAITHFVAALQIMPYYKSASDNLQTALAAYGNNQDAIVNMKKLLKVYPGDPTLHYILGNLYRNSGELDKAIEQYKKSLLQQPPLSHAMHNLAMVYATRKEYEKALFLLNQMAKLWPKSPGVYYYMTAIYAKQNNKEESIRWLKIAVKKGFKNWEMLKTDPKLENIKDTEYYQSLIRKH